MKAIALCAAAFYLLALPSAHAEAPGDAPDAPESLFSLTGAPHPGLAAFEYLPNVSDSTDWLMNADFSI